MQDVELSVLIPAFGYEADLPQQVSKTYSELSGKYDEDTVEVIVGYDFDSNMQPEMKGQVDEMRSSATNYGARFVDADYGRRLGVTGCLNKAFEESKGKVVATIDADLELDIKDLSKLIHVTDSGFDVVIGRRPGTLPRLSEQVVSSLFSKFGIYDPLCGLRVAKRNVLESCKGFCSHDTVHETYGAELYLSAIANGYTVTESGLKEMPRRLDSNSAVGMSPVTDLKICSQIYEGCIKTGLYQRASEKFKGNK